MKQVNKIFKETSKTKGYRKAFKKAKPMETMPPSEVRVLTQEEINKLYNNK